MQSTTTNSRVIFVPIDSPSNKYNFFKEKVSESNKSPSPTTPTNRVHFVDIENRDENLNHAAMIRTRLYAYFIFTVTWLKESFFAIVQFCKTVLNVNVERSNDESHPAIEKGTEKTIAFGMGSQHDEA